MLRTKGIKRGKRKTAETLIANSCQRSHFHVTTSTNHVNDQAITHITTTVNHPTPTRNQTVRDQPVVINAPDPSTPIRNRIRRRKRKTNRYWRRDNRNIQLDTNAVIDLSSVTLSQDENQLLARGLSFCPTSRNINWTETRANFHEFSTRRMRILEYFHDYPPPLKAIGPLPYTGTLPLTLFLMLWSMTS